MVPDFLCIGASRAGTTWLRVNLAHHPGIWLAPVKEIHYFDEPKLSVARRLLSFDTTHKRNRGRLAAETLRALRGERPNDAAWMARAMGRSRGRPSPGSTT